jgi:transposase-like protein
VNTVPEQTLDGRRRRRVHGDDFKAKAVAACMHPGISMAAVAMANGINANLLRRWVRAAEIPSAGNLPNAALPSHKRPVTQSPSAAFVPMQLNVLNGAVLASCKPRHRHQEFLAFLREIDKAVPAELDVHCIVDNYATHSHPRSRRGWPAGRAGTCTSSRPTAPGCIRSSAS